MGVVNLFVRLNLEIIGDEDQTLLDAFDETSSRNWFLLAVGVGPKIKVSIDLNPETLGTCYDSSPEVHGTEDSKIVANSFTDFVEKVLSSHGHDLHWQLEHFESLGYANFN